MGLLDDAIREHLELKRKHGGDPAELDQQARDALGPSRRDEAEPRSAAPAAPAPDPARFDPSWDDEDDHDLLPEPEVEAPARPRGSGGSVRADRPAEAPLADPERTRAFSVEEEREALAPRPAPAPEPSRERRRAEPVDEVDELEETPEFLEDTPEHDRLWFEQRPPKDFDF